MDRQHTVSWIRVKCCINVRRIAFEKACNRWMTLKVIQGHHRYCHLIYDFPLVFHCKCISILHRFRDINTYLPKSKDVTWPWPRRIGGQFVVTRLILHGPNRTENFKTVALAVPKIFDGVQNVSLGQVTLTTPPSGTVSYPRANTWYSLQQHKIWRHQLQ